MTSLSVTPLRMIVSLGILVLCAVLAIGLPNIWPYIFPGTRLAIFVLGASLAALTWAAGLYGPERGLLKALGICLVLAASASALWDYVSLFGLMGETAGAWRAARHSGIRSLWEGVGAINALSFGQKRAFATAAIVGLPPLVMLIIIAITAVAPAKNSRVAKSGPWQSKWMAPAGIRYLKSLTTGLPLGLSGGHLLRYQPDLQRGWRGGHHCVIAGTRAGKGVSAVIPAIIDHDGPVVVLDVKGENFAITRRWRQAQGRHVVVFNPFGVIEAPLHGFNPLDYVRHNHLVRDIDIIADGLIRPESGAGSHFAEVSRQIVAAAIEVVITTHDAEDRNLNAVADLLLGAEVEQTLETWANDPHRYGRRPAQAAATLLSAGDNERGGVKTTIKKAFEWARSDEMRSFLQNSTATLDELLDDNIDLFIAVPLDQLDGQAVFMRLFVNLVLGTVVRQDGRRTADKRILLVLDEFVRLGRMEKLMNIANVAAGAGIEALFVTQDKGQIEAVYGPNDTASLLGSCVTTRIFGLGRAETKTAEWAAHALGDQTVLTRSKQAGAKIGEPARISTNEHKQKLMTADQILEMPADEMLCLIGSKPPLRLKAIVSHTHPAYRKKLDPNPTMRA